MERILYIWDLKERIGSGFVKLVQTRELKWNIRSRAVLFYRKGSKEFLVPVLDFVFRTGGNL